MILFPYATSGLTFTGRETAAGEGFRDSGLRPLTCTFSRNRFLCAFQLPRIGASAPKSASPRRRRWRLANAR